MEGGMIRERGSLSRDESSIAVSGRGTDAAQIDEITWATGGIHIQQRARGSDIIDYYPHVGRRG